MKRLAPSISGALLLASLVLLAGCRRPAPATGGIAGSATPATRTVHDDFQRAVTLPVHVARVISLAPSSTEIVYALGAGDLLVGADRYSDYPPAARRLDKVGGNLDPSLERVVALRPDVVLTAASANGQRLVDTLSRLGLPVYVSRATALDGVLDDVRRLGEVVGRAQAGAELAAGLRRRLDVVAERASKRPTVRVLVMVQSDPLIVAGPGSYLDDMLRIAGGVNVAADSKLPFPNYSVERVLAEAPEVVIVGTEPDQDAAQTAVTLARLEARLTALPAVRAHRVHPVDGDLLFRPGPRVVDGTERLAALLHPELAAELEVAK